MSKVELICKQHGSLGQMEEEWIAKAQAEHDDIFSCQGPFEVIPVAVLGELQNKVEEK